MDWVLDRLLLQILVFRMYLTMSPFDLWIEADNTQVNRTFRLMDLPPEMRQKIFEFAVMVSEPVTPLQIKNRSNKFFWSKSQFYNSKDEAGTKRGVQGHVYGKPQLTILQLCTVSRQIYAEVALTHLFYKVNQFEFLTNYDALAYLVAITPSRLSAIQFIKTAIVPIVGCKDGPAQIYTLLAACKGLQKLELVVKWIDFRSSTFRQLPPGFPALLIAVQGLKGLSVAFDSQSKPEVPGMLAFTTLEEEESAALEWCKELEGTLRAESVHKRNPNYSIEMFEAAQEAANLDLDGDSRIDKHPKRGAVAKRTRQQIQNLDNISSDGTVPRRVCAKYDCDGILNWSVNQVSASRRADDDIYGVEFLADISRYVAGESRPRLDNIHDVHDQLLVDRVGLFVELGRHGGQCWENVSALNSSDGRRAICEFYRQNPTAYGKTIVRDIWKLSDGGDDGDDHKKALDMKRKKNVQARNPKYKIRTDARYTNSLNFMIQRETRLEQQTAAVARAISEAIGGASGKGAAKGKSTQG
jgi:hypothetical protein